MLSNYQTRNKMKQVILLIAICGWLLIGWKAADNNWIIQKHHGYHLFFKSPDKQNTRDYNKIVQHGVASVNHFFSSPYKKEFDVFIHPNRTSLDSTWQQDWNMPDFKSECWMVASGTATKLDMISPKMWDKESCEHHFADTKKTQQLITHELVHVYHGQLNASPDFSNTESIDWFVEGLATYASGQCDSLRIAEVKKAIAENKIPESLDDFWKGKIKYGLSGSVVMFIDYKYGRTQLRELLPFNKKADILNALKSTEPNLLEAWKSYMQTL